MTSSSYATALLAHRPPDAQPPIPPGLSTPALLLMAVACGLCAGSNYFNQPLLHSIATQLQVRDASAALIVTLAQVAYAAGLLLLVPLGDLLERRRLIVTLMLLAAFGLFTSGFAHSYAMLALGTLLTGLFSVAAQVLVPLAANLAHAGWVSRSSHCTSGSGRPKR